MPDALDLALFASGFISWAVSTVAAGGGSMLIVGFVAFLLGGQAVAPVVTIASLIAGPARMAFWWRHIDWRLVRWYVPGATAGAMLGGWAFSRISAQWIEIALAVFLLSTLWQYRFGDRERSFAMRLPWFVPVSFTSGLISAVIGASGLLVNPFYLNYGLMKESMLATRAANSIAIQLVKLVSYTTFGMLSWTTLRHGMAAGAGAVAAIWLANNWLRVLSTTRFRQFAVLVMALGGMMILWRHRALLGGMLTGWS